MGFKEIRTPRAAPGVHVGDRLAIFKRIDRGVLLRIQRALDLPGGLRAGIYDMQGKYPVLRQGWQRDENKSIKNRECAHNLLIGRMDAALEGSFALVGQLLAGAQVVFDNIKIGPHDAVAVIFSQRADEVAFIGQCFELEKCQNVVLNFFDIFDLKKILFGAGLFEDLCDQIIFEQNMNSELRLSQN